MQGDQHAWAPKQGRSNHAHHGHRDEAVQAQADHRLQRMSANMYVSAVLTGARERFIPASIPMAEERPSDPGSIATLLRRSWGRISRAFATPGRNDGA